MLELFKPSVTLVRDNVNGELEYTIHVTTIMDRTNYIPGGVETIPTSPENGVFKVSLKVIQNGVVDLVLKTPVVHTVPLGNLPLDSENPLIQVTVEHLGNKIGSAIVHQDDADDGVKPL